MRRSISRTAIVGSMAVAGLLASALPASAAYTDCPVGGACLWIAQSYSGTPNASYANSIVLSASNNKINSIVNNGRTSIAHFYDAANHTGVNISLNNPARGGQTRDPMLSNGTDATTVNWANRISSADFGQTPSHTGGPASEDVLAGPPACPPGSTHVWRTEDRRVRPPGRRGAGR